MPDEDPGREKENYDLIVSEVFHNLSQPLTALHCSLELSLQRDQTVEELRSGIQTALENAERLRQRLLLVRALAAAFDAGDLVQPTDLAELFRDLHRDMLPLFAASGVGLELDIDRYPILVRGNKDRLLQALFCFLEYLLRYARTGNTIAIRVAASGKQAEVVIHADSSLPIGNSAESPAGIDPTPYSCEIEMARRSFRAPGGEFALTSYRPDATVWRATLPCSEKISLSVDSGNRAF
ncbi:MAG: hypothetical protein WBW69_03235 [Candidatus Korobacteraceae bacterium]